MFIPVNHEEMKLLYKCTCALIIGAILLLSYLYVFTISSKTSSEIYGIDSPDWLIPFMLPVYTKCQEVEKYGGVFYVCKTRVLNNTIHIMPSSYSGSIEKYCEEIKKETMRELVPECDLPKDTFYIWTYRMINFMGLLLILTFTGIFIL